MLFSLLKIIFYMHIIVTLKIVDFLLGLSLNNEKSHLKSTKRCRNSKEEVPSWWTCWIILWINRTLKRVCIYNEIFG